MVNPGTFHVVATELTVGSFALAGLSFMLTCLATLNIKPFNHYITSLDAIAHFTLAFGLITTPFSIVTGIMAAPGTGLDHPMLMNKMLISSFAAGCAIGVLLHRKSAGPNLWDSTSNGLLHSNMGMASTGFILVTASIGGTFARGESLLDFLHLPYREVPVFPLWLSILVIIVATTTIVLNTQRTNEGTS